MKKLKSMFNRLKANRGRTIIVVIVLVAIGGVIWNRRQPTQTVQHQTASAEIGTLVTSISASGTITSGNHTSLTTKVSGVVDTVYITNGDTVTKGQKIAEVNLDEYATERQTAAWVAYLETTENAKQSRNSRAEADIAMWQARQDVLDAQEALNDMNDNDTNPATNAVYTVGERMVITKTLDQSRLAFEVTEAEFLNSGADIANANAKVAAALRDYQENSSTIVAPAAGVISDLSLAPGLVVNANSQTSSTSGATIISSQTIGKVSNPSGQLQAQVSLSEIDVITVQANQKVTLTLDAYSDKTFTGKVLSVDTTGGSSQGVTSYPATILLDATSVEIYPNMAVTAQIMLSAKADVLLIPSSAIQSTGQDTYVEVISEQNIVRTPVEVGETNDSQTEIVSGLTAGALVVTATIDPNQAVNFGSAGGFGGGFGGGGSQGVRFISR
jgi:multidrug efflux pump subunit AcrA (membrane-fusion protein)